MENINPKQKSEDVVLDYTLRPVLWDEYIGQTKVKQRLRIFIDAALQRKDVLDHILLYGQIGRAHV